MFTINSEQAANGAALVFCASVLRDFVLPKLFKTKKYVICVSFEKPGLVCFFA